MADAGAVGALSLALQVLKELHSYYTKFKSHDDDIAAVTTRLDHLHVILRVLERPVQRLDYDDNDPLTEELWSCVAECLKGVKKLQIYRDKCYENKQVGERLSIQDIKNRVAYPFRKGTLEDIQKLLDRLLQNLQLILQALHLDTSIQYHQGMMKQAEIANHRLRNVEGQQQHISTTLQVLSSQTNAHIISSSAGHGQTHYQLQNQTSQLVAMANGHDLILKKLEELTVSLQSNKEPNMYATSHRTCEEIHEQLPTGLISQTSPESRTTFYGLECRCRPRTQKSWTWLPPPIQFFLKRQWKHLPHCPLFVPAHQSSTVGIRFRLTKKGVIHVTETGFLWEPGYIAPYVTFRRVTDYWNSPAVRTVQLIGLFPLMKRKSEKARLSDLLGIVVRGLSQLLLNGSISLLDEDQFGKNIFHHMTDSLYFCYRKNFGLLAQDFDSINEVSRLFISWGFEANKISSTGSTPLDTLLSEVEFDCLIRTPVLAQLECRWERKSIYEADVEWGYSAVSYDNYQRIARSSFSGLSDDPLLISIFQQSNVALSTQLERRPNLEDENFKQFLLCAAVSWPAGLQLLLQHISSAPSATCGLSSPLISAIMTCNLESVEILLRYKIAVTCGIWMSAVISRNISIIRMIVGELGRQFQSYSSLRIGYMRTTTGFEETLGVLDTLYYQSRLTCEMADCLYEAGFVNVDATQTHVNGFNGTALSYHCSLLSWDFFTNTDKLELIDWFILKGASIGCTQSRNTLKPIHVLAERLGEYLSTSSTQGLKDLKDQIRKRICIRELTQEHFDDCRCACSAHGCENLILLCKGLTQSDSHTSIWLICQCLTVLGFNLEKYNTRMALLRMLTFIELELTHTCHRSGRYNLEVEYMTEDDIRHTQEQERNDIQLLENLLITFEETWINHQGTFLDFIEEIWHVKMAEVRKEKEAKLPPLEEELCNIINLGVVLERFGPEELRSTDLGPEYGTLKWAEWYMSKVLDGTYVNYPSPICHWEWTAVPETEQGL